MTFSTAFIDGCLRDLRYAFRSFRRAPLAAVTIVLTVAVGLGLVAVVFTLFSAFLFRVDAVPNPHELYGVERPRTPDGERVLLTRPQFDALQTETSVFSNVFAMVAEIDTRVDGRTMDGALVTGNFFQVLGVHAARGRTLTPGDDERFAGRPVMVLSHGAWTRVFANDPAAIGRKLIVNGLPYEIVGVMPDGFRGLSVNPPDYWAPLSMLGQVRPANAGREDTVGIDIIGRLKTGLSRETALAGLAVWDTGRTESAVEGRPVNITLVPRRGTIPQPVEALMLFTPIFFAFGLILMIGCANVGNLLMARAVARQREIGVRLSLGASRQRIIRQLLTESLLLALASAALGMVISRVVLEATVYAVMSTMSPEVAEGVRISAIAADWRVWLFLVASAIVATGLFGLAPALQATRVELVRAVRGEVSQDARPSRMRNVLIGVQVMASALLLICSAVFLRSALTAATKSPGIRTSDTLVIEMASEPLRDATLQAVSADQAVTAVAASWPAALAPPRAAFANAPAGSGTSGRSAVAYRLVSPEYFGVLDIGLVKGRGFAPGERAASAAVAVVSERIAGLLWPDRDAVGQVLHLDPDPNAPPRRGGEPPLTTRAFTVVGVAREVAGFRFAGFEEANVYLPTSAAAAMTGLTVRVQGDPSEARRLLLQRLTAVDPNVGQVITYKAVAGLDTYLLQVGFWLTLVLGGLALALTVSGLFSVLSYLVEQRMKEIGVRMALGASSRSVSGLVLWQSVRPVGVGLVAGTALALALATVLMSSPAAAQIGGLVQVFDPVAYLASVVCILSACALAALIPALRAARIDPMQTLKQE